jgi:hypothetical protein
MTTDAQQDAVSTATADDASTAGDTDSALTLGAEELTRRLDRLNLTQALLDFEVANARVLDLTARLVESNKRVLTLQAENDATRGALEGARTDIAELQGRIVAIESSTTYRAAQKAAQKLRSVSRLKRFLRK